ncbi:aspartic peptidase domain-containing protein [Sporodiniella umbellata]|nr:aspartic peptidase domain-containing protein [Sporodiniella umbellata]
MRFALVCLATIAQLALNSVAEPITIPLYKRTEDGDIYKAAGKALDNGVLAGKVKLGSTAQEFVFAFDTTTGFSWVRGSDCKTKNCRGRCTYYATKSEHASSTGQKFSVNYGDSCVDTHVYTDTFEFAGLKVHDFPFGGAYRMNGFASGFDGYLGLGRSVDFNTTHATASTASSLAKRDGLGDSAFVPTAFQQGSGISSSQFGMYTTSNNDGFNQDGSVGGSVTNTTTTTTTPNPNPNPNPNPVAPNTGVTSGGFGTLTKRNNGGQKEEKPAGYLVIGGVDKSAIEGDVAYIRLADDPGAKAKNWDLCIRHANFGPLKLEQKKRALASISTSTNVIAMPPKQADQFHEKFGGFYDKKTKLYQIKCSEAKKLPALKMTLEDHIVELPAKYWTAVVDADRDCCTTKITRGGSDRDWVLGTSLTNAFYTTFDPDTETVGLAIKKGHSKDGLRVYKKSH